MNKLLKIFISIIVFIFLILVLMAIFKICPPDGPWIMPPWCGKGKIEKSNVRDKNTNNNYLDDSSEENGKINSEINKKEVEKNILEEKKSVDAKEENIITEEAKNNENILNPIRRKNFQKGVVFGAMKWSSEEKKYIDHALETAQDFGVNWIALVPEWFVSPDEHGVEIKAYYSNKDFPNTSGWVSPTLSDEEINNIIQKAKQKGIEVVLKPHIDPIDFGMKSGSSRGSLAPRDWNKFFLNYENFILHYARLAEKQKLPMFIIGTELDTVVRDMPGADKKWRELISQVRKVYSGSLTYSASCFGECWSPRQVSFWDALDYIGFEPYFSLTTKNNPTTLEMKQAFDNKLNKFAKPLYLKYHKPIIITEANVYSYDGVNKNPLNPPPAKAKADQEEQADYYEALMQSTTEKDWIQGIYWWAWYLSSTVSGDYSRDLYDPFIHKKAGEVLNSWYNRIRVD